VSFAQSLRQHVQAWRENWSLPEAARVEKRRDRKPLPPDPGSERVLHALMGWLCEAQDRSASADGGVARSYDLLRGWETSYPETTGYIVPTLLDYARRFGRDDHRERARRMCDWLVAIQMADGGFQGGRIDSVPAVPVTFTPDKPSDWRPPKAVRQLLEPMRRARLAGAHASSGSCWRRIRLRCGAGREGYETHVSGVCSGGASSRRAAMVEGLANVRG
jgi:hypothetical protein